MEFIYKAKNREGNITQGIIEARNESEAVSILHKKDLVILSLEPKEQLFTKDISVMLSRPKTKDVVVFTRQLATLIDADVPLVNSLNTLAEQTDNVAFRKVLKEITNAVDAGSSLSDALAKYPHVFSKFYISLVKSGETAGKLHEVLRYLADYLENQADIRSKTMGALIYPLFLLIAIIAVFIVLFFGFPLLQVPAVIPQILSVVQDAGIEDIPITTKVLILANNVLTNYWYMWIITFLILAVWFYNYINTPQGRINFDRLKLNLPFVKKAIKGIYLARLAETLSTLIKAGVPILESLEITSYVVGNKAYQNMLLETKDKVSKGSSISEVFAKYPGIIPPLITQMITIGEKTGKMEFMLGHISKFYSNEANSIINNLPSIIEPIVVLFFGVVVFIMVSGVMLPLFSLIR